MRRWDRLGAIVRAERLRRGHRTIADFARAAGVSPGTVSNLERGARRTYLPETLAVVEAALGWQAGSMAQVIEGGTPTREVDDDLQVILAIWPRLDQRSRLALRRAAEALRCD